MTGAASRDKGQRGELELAALLTELTGYDVRRRVRQHDGDSDLEGLPGWSVECKRRKRMHPANVSEWWAQTCTQASRREHLLPLLCARPDRGGWRFHWPASLHCEGLTHLPFIATLEADPQTWWAMTRDFQRMRLVN